MSILITNMGPTDDDQANDVLGERNYVLKINEKVLGYFKHYRKDGLSKCLMKAASIAKNHETNHIDLFLKEKE